MKLALSLLAVLSLVGPSTYAQKRGGGSSSSSSHSYSAPATRSYSAPRESTQSRQSYSPPAQPYTPKTTYSAPAPKNYVERNQPQPQQQRSYSNNNNTRQEAPKQQQQTRQETPRQQQQTRQEVPRQQQQTRQEVPRQEQQTRQESPKQQQPKQEQRQQQTRQETPKQQQQQQSRQNQQQSRQEQKQLSQAEQRAKLPPRVAEKTSPTAKVSCRDNGGCTVRDGQVTKVYDAQGKQRANYDNLHHVDTFNLKSGANTVSRKDANNHVMSTQRTSADGRFKETTDHRTGERHVEFKGANGNEYKYRDDRTKFVTRGDGLQVYQRTVIVNNVRVYDNRTYVRVYNQRYGSYYGVYEPVWWAPSYVWPVYAPFYGSYWGPSYFGGYYGIAAWNGGYYYRDNYWRGVYGWGWWDYSPYYSAYVFPVGYDYYYPSLSFWLADYLISRSIQNDMLARQAAEADAQAELEFDTANAAALNKASAPLDKDTRKYIAQQVEEMVSIVKKRREGLAPEDELRAELQADNMAYKGHLFTVNEIIPTSTVIDDNTVQCKLHAGDVIGMDTSVDPQTIEDTDADGNVITDNNDNPVKKTIVTVYVKASKMSSCRPGLEVTVTLDQLQEMVNDELAAVQEGMEKAVNNHVHP